MPHNHHSKGLLEQAPSPQFLILGISGHGSDMGISNKLPGNAEAADLETPLENCCFSKMSIETQEMCGLLIPLPAVGP